MRSTVFKQASLVGIGVFAIAGAFLPLQPSVSASNPIVEAIVKRTRWDIAVMVAVGAFLLACVAGSMLARRHRGSSNE